MLQLRLPIPRFVSPAEIFSGAGALGSLRALDAAKAVVLASSSVLNKHREILERSIGAEALRLIEMPRGEPTVAALKPVLSELEFFQPDWIIAVGGGSVIDAAKIAWVLYEHPAVERDRLLRAFGVPTLRGKARLVAVPTTVGAGSEVSSAAVLLDPQTRVKHAMISHELLPDVVVLDQRLAINAPTSVIANAGLDALAHALESYVSQLENPLADILAEKAAAEIITNLPLFYHAPDDLAICQRMQNAALLAGWVQNQKVPGIGHAIAHQLGEQVSHGHATGRLLASAMRFNCDDDAVREKYDTLAKVLGFSDSVGLLARVEALVDELNVINLPDSVFANASALAIHAMEDPCARFNPRAVNEEAVVAVLKDAR